MNAKRLATLLAVLPLAAACAVGPSYERPPLATPEAHRGAAPAAAANGTAPGAAVDLADRGWWELFSDPTLIELVDEALASGHDVRLAAARVEEARALAGIARSARYPQIDLAAGGSRGRSSAFTGGPTGTGETYAADLGLSWEIDLWGRVRRLDESARARYLATEEARRGVALSLVSEVATSYFRLRALDRQLEIARRTAEAFGSTHELFESRLDAGLASALETSSALASLESTAAAIPELARRIAAEENRLGVLLGRLPGEISRGAALDAQHLPIDVPAGLPSTLLERRPDLARAEQELVAANAEVGVAAAELLPRVSLTAAFGGLAPEVSELFGDGERWSVGGGLLAPIFQGGRLRAQHRAALARWEQAKVVYEKSVITAFAEVATELVAYRELAEVERRQEAAVAAFREAVDHASSRYRSGLSGYLEVLQAQQQLFPAENALAQARLDRLSTLVDLYRALGGGWQLEQDWTSKPEQLATAPATTTTEDRNGTR